MPSSKEFRARAWNNLKGKYWRALAVAVIVSIVASVGTSFTGFSSEIDSLLAMVAESGVEIDEVMQMGANLVQGIGLVSSVIGALYFVFVSDPLSIGEKKFYVLNTTETPSFKTLLCGFKNNYKNNVITLLLVSIKIFLWSLLFIIPGIIKSYEYAMIPFILGDNPEIGHKEAFAMSKAMMKGNKMNLFLLELSFIGWILLSLLTCGIGSIFLNPYFQTARAEFYKELKSRE